MANITNETAFFEACESNEINTAIFLLRYVDVSSLKKWRTCGGRTCLHVVVVAGSSDLLRELAAKLGLEADLFDREDDDGETPLSMAVGLGFVEAVELLITRTSNALHLVAELNQVKLVQILIKNNVVDLSKLIDQPYQPVQSATKNKNKTEGKRLTDPSDDEEDNSVTNFQPIRGDTPLHIAVKNKYEHMVNLLLKIPGVKKDARNSNGKTALQIAREVTGYHESFRIIRKLADCEGRQKPFMYCAPQVSHKKHMEASKMVNKAFEDRRNTELVVAALLATMTFTAAFTVPGGFQTDEKQREELGSPVLISFTSFKLFLVFDCTAFFLSLFVCIMWQMSSELTTEDKTFFLTVTGLLVCCCFGFTAYGFMAAVYTMLAHKSMTFTWVVLGNLIAITLCGILAFIHQSVKFIVARARFHRLFGVPCVFDDIVEDVWSRAESCVLLKPFRSVCDFTTGLANFCRLPQGGGGGGGGGGCQHLHSYNNSCSSSPCPLNGGNVSRPD